MQTHVQVPASTTTEQARQQQHQPEYETDSAQLLRTPQFEDGRPEVIAQLHQQSLMANSQRTTQLQAIRAMMAASPRVQQLKTTQTFMAAGTLAKQNHQASVTPITQRMEDEEPLQPMAEEPVQREQTEAPATDPTPQDAPPSEPPKPNNTGLPDNLKSGIENLSGMSMDHVKVHYNSDKPAQLQAHAYAQGSEIHVAPGQEQHLPHEAWHVVQQAQGRVKPTVQMKGGVNVNDDVGLEEEADLMGEWAVQVMTERQNTRPEPVLQAQKMILENVSGTNLQGLENASNEVTVQRIRETAGGAKIFEEADALKKKESVILILNKLQEKLVDATGVAQELIRKQIEGLQGLLAKYDLMPNTEAFVSVMPEQQKAVGNVLWLDLEFADYKVGDNVANGEYQFVILVANPSQVLMTQGSGHQSIAGDNPVYYAGTAYFSVGELVYWNNNTGHYRTDEAHAPQAEIPKLEGVPYLPMAKFRSFNP